MSFLLCRLGFDFYKGVRIYALAKNGFIDDQDYRYN
jgi:hypothetical protein